VESPSSGSVAAATAAAATGIDWPQLGQNLASGRTVQCFAAAPTESGPRA
jgi:hypothetical protein